MLASQEEDYAAGRGAEQRPDEEPAGDRPEHVDGKPAPATLPGLMQSKQTETEHDEGECRSVVEPSLSGEGKAQPVPVSRSGDLDIGRQHRVGRRQHRPEQDRGAQRQLERGDPDERDETDRERHRP